MRDLWNAISEQPALLIFLVLALLSWVGNLAGGAAKKAQAEAQRKAQAQRAQRPRTATAAAPRDPRGQQAELRPQAATSSAPTAEDIAAEIRRVMGFESEPVRVEPPQPPPVVVADHERWAGERVKAAPATKPRPKAPPSRVQQPRARRRRRRLLDLSNPAAAIVLMEVLGKPRALRGFED